MKKAKEGLKKEYSRKDLGAGVRGKYAKKYNEGTNLFLISPDVAAFFKTEEAINEALAQLMKLAKKAAKNQA